MDSNSHPYVIDADAEGSSQETAVLLIGTAQEAGLDPAVDVQKITRPYPGFRITEALALALDGSLDADDDDDEDGDPSGDATGDDDDPSGDATGDDDDETKAPEPDLSGNKQSLAPEHDIHGQPTEVAYQDWEYNDLKAAVKTRGIEVENQRTETLIAALIADDKALADDEDEESDSDADAQPTE